MALLLWGLTIDEAKQSKLAYYVTISFVDAEVGCLLDALARMI